MTTAMEQAAAIALSVLPEETWEVNDDACDCTFQRIGFWTNPYIGETLEVRMCCIWEELYKLFPQYVRKTDAFRNYNTDDWEREPWEWNGETEMPKSIWYRQLARKFGKPVAEIRAEYQYRDDERPRGIPRPVVEGEPEPDMLATLFQIVLDMAGRLDALEGK